MNNEDSSSISFRKFNFSPKDEYPTITICIAEGYDSKPIFAEHRLEKSFENWDNLQKFIKDYWNTINGINTTTEEINKLPEFSNVTLHLEDFMVGKANLEKFYSYDSFPSGKTELREKK